MAMSRRGMTTAIGTVLLLLAAALRLFAFGESPPGLQHDEMFKAVEGRLLIEAGDFRVFYPSNQGHEGAFVWLSGVSQALVGSTVLGVRLPALFAGLLTVALAFRVVGQTVSLRAGVLTAGLLAVSFMGLYTSRVGLRAVLLPVMILLVAGGLDALRRGWRPNLTAVLTGAALGLSLYTYTSSIAVWAGAAAFALWMIVCDRRGLRDRWRAWMLLASVAVVLALPMVAARLTDPQGFNRASTITRPLTEALAGNPQELIDNGLKLLGMAAFTGDPEARYNVPGRPLFVLPVGLLAYAGIGLMAWRLRRNPLHAFWLAVMAFGIVPSLLTVSAPSFLRSIAVLTPLALGIALVVGKIPRRLGWTVGLAAVALTGVLDSDAYFRVWPSIPEVQEIYRDDLEQLAATLHEAGITRALVSTPDAELDARLFPYYLLPDSVAVTFFDGDTNLVLVTGADLFESPLARVTDPHRPWLSEDYGALPVDSVVRQDGEIAFEHFQLSGAEAARDRLLLAEYAPVYVWDDSTFPRGTLDKWATPISAPVSFGGMVELVGVELDSRRIARDSDGVNLQIYLHPLIERQPLPLNVFVHVVRLDGTIHAQRDLLGVRPEQWQTDMTIIQDHFVIMGPSAPGPYIVLMGIYDVVTGARLPVLDAEGNAISDFVILGRVIVGE